MGGRPNVGWHVLCALLVVRLLTDIATPLMPGAFRFNPEESVEGLRSQPVRAIQDAATRAPRPPSVRVEDVPTTRPLAYRVAARVSTALRFQPPLARYTPDYPHEASEDPLIAAIPLA